jgi:hypothetical protein
MQPQVFRQRDLNLAERLVGSLTHAGVAITHMNLFEAQALFIG